MTKTIAVVEDDVFIGNLLEELLRGQGYLVRRAYSGSEALLVLEGGADLVLLDLNLPGLSGEEVLRRIAGTVPVIVLSAKNAPADKIANLLGGASDYVTKPFDNDELLARIAVRLRETRAGGGGKISACGIVMDDGSYEAEADGRALRLTKTEFAILYLLVANPKTVFSKSAILDRISAYTPDGEESSVSVHISNLRQKLTATTGRNCIDTVWGIGFKLAAKS